MNSKLLTQHCSIHERINLRGYAERKGIKNITSILRTTKDALWIFRFDVCGSLFVRDIARGDMLRLTSLDKLHKAATKRRESSLKRKDIFITL
jgi:hypothetical protein